MCADGSATRLWWSPGSPPTSSRNASGRSAKGSDADAEAFESVVYEGHAAGGVAVLVEALTDNRNRTGSEVRHLFSDHAGGLGEPGSVAWNFDKKGVVLVDGERHHEDDLIVAIDAGAEDLVRDENVWEIVTRAR